jgi:hypothetical protein
MSSGGLNSERFRGCMSGNHSRRPALDEHHDFYLGYIQKVPDGEFFHLLFAQRDDIGAVLNKVDDSQACVLHPPRTWTLKQVVGHLIDVERVFSDRLLRIAFGDEQPQPGMDQDLYVRNADYESPGWTSLVDELLFCRRANELLLRRLRPEAWDRRGTASGSSVTVRALAWMLIGHVEHHMAIVRQRLASTV